MKAVETVLHLRQQFPRRMRNMVPEHVWALVKPYGLMRDVEKTRIAGTSLPPEQA
jgi:coenzyme F420 hydrogenase subunit beta